VHQADHAPAISPAGWLASSLLFGIPALTFAFLFHWAGPSLLRQMSSWWRVFHLLLILPLALMLIAALVGAAIDVRSISWKALTQRLRLSAPNATACIWAAALSGFMYGGNWEDLFAVAASWLALWRENNRRVWVFAAILIGTIIKRSAGILRPTLQSIRFFDASGFYHEFFDRFGPKDFMGIPLHGAWWVLVYYAVVILVCNIGGEECGGAVMCSRAKNSRLEGPHGSSTGFSGRSSTYLCSRLSGTQSAWQSQVSHSLLLRNEQEVHGQASSATALETLPSSYTWLRVWYPLDVFISFD
jgi:hypothetical protein